jgi:uncharacterized OB-fold protein
VDPLVRDAIEVLLVVAVGGILWSAIGRLRRGEIEIVRCPSCGRTSSRAYQHCAHCGAEIGTSP